MARALSLSQATTNLLPRESEGPADRPCSAASVGSGGTVQHHRIRSISTSSLSSLGSYLIPNFRVHPTSASAPQRSASSFNVGKIRAHFERGNSTTTTSRRTSIGSALSRRLRPGSLSSSDPREHRLFGLTETDLEISSESEESSFNREDGGELETLHFNSEASITAISSRPHSLENHEALPFLRWVSRIRRKRHCMPPIVSPRQERWTLDDFDARRPSPHQLVAAHCKSDSHSSSMKFVTAMKSATTTLASVSIATVSRRTTRWRSVQQRSSLMPDKNPRPSIESVTSIVDEAAKQRSRKRRQKVEEFIRTEESYVADVKALSNAYFTILGHQATSSGYVRPVAQKTIAEILDLHDELLGELHRVVPFAEYDQSTARASSTLQPRSHTRWHSVDIVPQGISPDRAVLATIRHGRRSLNISRSSEDDPAVLRCSPQIAAGVAEVFAKYIKRLEVYEDYGAICELLQRDIDETQRMIAIWPEFDKAIEAISAHVNPVRSREANRRRAMTFKDLLIKPVQRLPRYVLLFQDLCTVTPVCDDPDSHATITGVCVQLNLACQRMNQAKNDSSKARTLETTWLIGNRLGFSSQVPRSVFLQLLGQVSLCGCLHIAYRSREKVKGRYVACALFETSLLLSDVEDDQSKYCVVAAIALANATVEETDNLKGLHCYTAPHSWKVVFEHSARMYELIFTACSAVETNVWRSHLASGIESQTQAVAEHKTNVFELHSSLILEMKSIGRAFGKPGSFVRRMSVHRAATVGPTTDLNQVIIRNTQAIKEVQNENETHSSLQIPRSQSVQTPSHVQTLTPSRADRIRLENLLSDVWSRELLPYPGMIRRSDPLRASANQFMRKISIASITSITSNFSSSKRSASYTGLASSLRKEDIPPTGAQRRRHTSRAPNQVQPSLVTFHNTPDAFLPADFELQQPGAKRKRSALRTLTLTMERPFSPSLVGDVRTFGVRRAQSVRDVAVVAPATDGPAATTALTAADDAPFVSEPSRRPSPSAHIPPHYSVVHERAKTPALPQHEGDTACTAHLPTKAPRKHKSKLFRIFG